MKLKYIFITIGSMLLLLGLLTFSSSSYRGSGGISYSYSIGSIISAVLGLGTLLTGIFWKKQ